MDDLEMQWQTAKLKKFKTNHILHLLITVLSFATPLPGFWIPMWLLVSLSNAIERGKANRKIRKILDRGKRSTDLPQ